MNRRLFTILICALIISAGASLVVYRVVGRQLRAKDAPKTARIMLAARNLEVGTIIKDADLRPGEWVGLLPKGFSTGPEAVVGRGVVAAVYEGEPILDSRLAAPGSGGGLASTIPPGMRACAVRVNDVVGVAGFVVPGMRVDVLVSGNPGGTANAGTQVKTLLQNIEVLSAGTNIQKDAEGKPVNVQVVNLLVTPEQAESLSLASNETRIQLVLRNPLDTQVAKTTGRGMASLFSDTGAAPAPAPAAAPKNPVRLAKAIVPRVEPVAPAPVVKPVAPGFYLVEVLNGTKRSEAKFDRPEEQK